MTSQQIIHTGNRKLTASKASYNISASYHSLSTLSTVLKNPEALNISSMHYNMISTKNLLLLCQAIQRPLLLRNKADYC